MRVRPALAPRQCGQPCRPWAPLRDGGNLSRHPLVLTRDGMGGIGWRWGFCGGKSSGGGPSNGQMSVRLATRSWWLRCERILAKVCLRAAKVQRRHHVTRQMNPSAAKLRQGIPPLWRHCRGMDSGKNSGGIGTVLVACPVGVEAVAAPCRQVSCGDSPDKNKHEGRWIFVRSLNVRKCEPVGVDQDVVAFAKLLC